MQEFAVPTRSRIEFVDITSRVQEAVRGEGVSEGICHVFVPHTTAGCTINENADPDVTRDVSAVLSRLVPHRGDYRHVEGNSDSHTKASMVGFSVSVPVADGRLVLCVALTRHDGILAAGESRRRQTFRHVIEIGYLYADKARSHALWYARIVLVRSIQEAQDHVALSVGDFLSTGVEGLACSRPARAFILVLKGTVSPDDQIGFPLDDPGFAQF